MSGSIDYSILFPDTTNTGQPSLLGTFYGNGVAKKSATPPLIALRIAEASEAKQVAATAKQPAIARDIAAFKAAVAKAKSPLDLLKNPVALKVLLTANGLADRIDTPALAQKTLLSDTTDSKSLVNRITDTRWKPVTKTYDFAHKGLTILRDPKVLDTVAHAYAEIAWRKSLDAATPGLSSALDFRGRAASVKSYIDILGDPILRDVITTALGIPKQIAFQELPAQEKAIASRLDLAKLKDKHFVDAFSQRYLLNKANDPNAVATQPTLDQLISKSAGLLV